MFFTKKRQCTFSASYTSCFSHRTKLSPRIFAKKRNSWLKSLPLVWLLLLPGLALAQSHSQLHCGVQPRAGATPPAPDASANRPNLFGPNPSTTACFEVQNVRVNIHFLQHDNGSGNFTATDDGRPGNPSTTLTGCDYAQGLIYFCNSQMDQNPPLRLAAGSLLTPIPKRVRWVLNGV